MATKSPLEQALRRFTNAGVAPELWIAHALDSSRAVTALFDADLSAIDAGPLPATPGNWRALSVDEAMTLLALRRHRTQAYDDSRGQPSNHLRAAREVLDAIEAQRAWTNTDVLDAVDPVSLKFPDGGYGFGTAFMVGSATFEDLVLVEGRTHALLAMWIDED